MPLSSAPRLALCVSFLAACGQAAAVAGADAPPPPSPDAPPPPPPPPPDAPPPGTTRITFTNQLIDGTAADTGFVAFQDGDGAWTPIAGAGYGVYAFDVVGPRYGLVTACVRASDGSSFVNLGYFTVSDGAARYAVDGCAGDDDDEDLVLLSATIRNAAPGAEFFITDGLERQRVIAPGPFTVPALAGAGTLATISLDLSRMALQPVSFVDGATLDIDAAGAFALAEADLTLDLSAETYSMQTRYQDATGGLHRVDANQTATGFVATRYRAVPTDKLAGGISTIVESGPGGGGSRIVTHAFRTPVPQVLRLPEAYPLPVGPLIVATAPYPILSAKLPRRAGASFYTLSYERSSARTMSSSTWSLTFSAAYADSTPAAAVFNQLPDLSGLAGWNERFALPSAGNLFWLATVNAGPARLVPGAAPLRAHGRSTAVLEDGDETTSASTGGMLP